MKNHDPMTNKTKGPIPLPEGDVPEGVRCVSLCIPDSDDAYRLLFGALYELTHWNNWDRDPEHKGTLWAKAWRTALLEGMLRCYQFRTNGGVPQFSNDGGATWSNVPAVNDGSSGYDPRTDEPLLPARTGDNKPCLAAANATAVFVELHREVVQWYNDNAIPIICLGAIALAIGIFFPVSWAVFGLSLSSVVLATFFLTHTAVLNNAAFTSTIQDELTCIFYCHADLNGQWSTDAWTLILGDIDAKSGEMWELIHYYVQDIAGVKGLNNAGTTTSIATHDCGGCGCGWCYTLDFEEGQKSFTPVVAFGQQIATYVAGQGWRSVYNRDGGHITEVRIERTLGSTGQFSSVDIEYSSDYETTDGYTLYFNVNIGPVPSGSHQHKVVTFAEVDETRLRTDIADSVNHGGETITIHKMTYRGVGTNPFGGDNCT